MQNRKYLIGIAGGSASGKTTFSEQFKSTLNKYQVKIIHMDDYFKEDNLRPMVTSFLNNQSYRDDNHPTSFNLTKLYTDLNQFKEESYDIIIIEGLFTLWDENIYNQLNLKLFIDCPADERIVRRLKRNMQRGLSFDEISEVYLNLVRFRHAEYVEPSKWKADIIVPGMKSFDSIIQIICENIDNQLEIK